VHVLVHALILITTTTAATTRVTAWVLLARGLEDIDLGAELRLRGQAAGETTLSTLLIDVTDESASGVLIVTRATLKATHLVQVAVGQRANEIVGTVLTVTQVETSLQFTLLNQTTCAVTLTPNLTAKLSQTLSGATVVVGERLRQLLQVVGNLALDLVLDAALGLVEVVRGPTLEVVGALGQTALGAVDLLGQATLRAVRVVGQTALGVITVLGETALRVIRVLGLTQLGLVDVALDVALHHVEVVDTTALGLAREVAQTALGVADLVPEVAERLRVLLAVVGETALDAALGVGQVVSQALTARRTLTTTGVDVTLDTTLSVGEVFVGVGEALLALATATIDVAVQPLRIALLALAQETGVGTRLLREPPRVRVLTRVKPLRVAVDGLTQLTQVTANLATLTTHVRASLTAILTDVTVKVALTALQPTSVVVDTVIRQTLTTLGLTETLVDVAINVIDLRVEVAHAVADGVLNVINLTPKPASVRVDLVTNPTTVGVHVAVGRSLATSGALEAVTDVVVQLEDVARVELRVAIRLRVQVHGVLVDLTRGSDEALGDPTIGVTLTVGQVVDALGDQMVSVTLAIGQVLHAVGNARVGKTLSGQVGEGTVLDRTVSDALTRLQREGRVADVAIDALDGHQNALGVIVVIPTGWHGVGHILLA